MEFIILGLLMLRGMTIYEIKTFISNNLETMCSPSSGSIHTAIRKLLDKKFISFEEEGNKKIYYILELGREEFNSWIGKPMDLKKAKNIELSKLFFLGLSEKENRIAIIEKYIEDLTIEYDKLIKIAELINENNENIVDNALEKLIDNKWNVKGIKWNVEIDEMKDKVKDVYKYQQATLEYGIASIEFEINWYKNYISKIKD